MLTRSPRAILLPVGVVILAILSALATWIAWGPLPMQSVNLSGATASAVSTSQVDLQWPTSGASAFTLTNVGDATPARTVSVHDTNGNQSPQRIASITKLITVLRVLEVHPLAAGESGPRILLTEADAQSQRDFDERGGATEPVPVGQSLTEREVIQLALIASSNNYTATLARWAFGDEATFVAGAPAWLAAHGLAGVVQVDPTGMEDGNVATPEQIVHLGELAQANPVIAEITSQATAEIPGVGQIRNHNTLLGSQGVDGLKTGTLAGIANLVWTAHFSVAGTQFSLTGATLGGTGGHAQLQPEIGALIGSIERSIKVVTAATAGENTGTAAASWGAEVSLSAASDVVALTWGDEDLVTEVTGGAVPAEAQAGTQVGTLALRRGDEVLAQTPLLLARPVDDPGLAWRFAHAGDFISLGLASLIPTG